MKKILGLLLACVLLMSAVSAVALEDADTAMFNLQGYAIGRNAEDTRMKFNKDWVDSFVYLESEEEMMELLTAPDVLKNGYFLLQEEAMGTKNIVTGPLEADKAYVLMVVVPLEEDERVECEAVVDARNFDLETGCFEKDATIGTAMDDDEHESAIFTFQLKPAPKTLPATGDGAELMMWSAMVAFAAVSLVALNKKRVFGR